MNVAESNETGTDVLLYKIPDVVRMLNLSRSTVFELLRTGRLRSVHQGRSRLIPATSVREYVGLLEQEDTSAR